MKSSIFSTYSQAENRVTSQIFDVIFQLSSDVANKILGTMLNDPDFSVVKHKNQMKSSSESSVPDYVISSSLCILIETKIKRNAVRLEQIKGHINVLDSKSAEVSYLLVITPDMSMPRIMNDVDSDGRVLWCSFQMLYDSIVNEVLNSEAMFVSEKDRYLLHNVIAFLVNEGLCQVENKDVVVVAARIALEEYKSFSAYICPSSRTFRGIIDTTKYIAFYTNNEISRYVPKILRHYQDVKIEKNAHNDDPVLSEIISKIIENGLAERERKTEQIFVLSPIESPETVVLPASIKNIPNANGKRSAFIQNKAYLSLEKLLRAATTEDLKERKNN